MYKKMEDDSWLGKYGTCRACGDRIHEPRMVCDECFYRNQDFELDEASLYVPVEEKIYRRADDGGRTPPTDALFQAAIAESEVALKKADYREQVDNLLGIALVIRERVERFQKENARAGTGESEQEPWVPSMIDYAFRNAFYKRGKPE